MKKSFFAQAALIFALVSILGGTAALSMEHSGHGRAAAVPEQSAPGSGQVFSAAGIIEKISGNALTISHGAVPALNWPSMTMVFVLESEDLLEGVKEGDKISFDFRAQGNSFIIVNLEAL
ncbi:MAG: copper-binding protein [Deltaproteobacteria bacterium]|jgi:Cu/Ag efflux protein CusF|nr:copper-binding protein [Deltaproteobacteria bacterium]